MDRFVSLRISLIAAPDDASIADPEYQHDLRQFHQRMMVEHERVGAALLTADAKSLEDGLSGDFVIPLEHVRSLVVTGAAIGWCEGRAGRAVGLKVGSSEAKVYTLVQCDRFLSLAKAQFCGSQGGNPREESNGG